MRTFGDLATAAHPQCTGERCEALFFKDEILYKIIIKLFDSSLLSV